MKCLIFLVRCHIWAERYRRFLEINLPKASSNKDKTSRILLQFCASALPRIRLSSSNNKWVMKGEVLEHLIPFIHPDLAWCLRIQDSPSEHIRKRYEAKGHPCLNPLLILKLDVALPLTKWLIQKRLNNSLFS